MQMNTSISFSRPLPREKTGRKTAPKSLLKSSSTTTHGDLQDSTPIMGRVRIKGHILERSTCLLWQARLHLNVLSIKLKLSLAPGGGKKLSQTFSCSCARQSGSAHSNRHNSEGRALILTPAKKYS